MSSYLEEYGVRIIEPSQELGKELSKEVVISFNRANLKRFRKKTLRLIFAEHASEQFEALISERLSHKDHGSFLTPRKVSETCQRLQGVERK